MEVDIHNHLASYVFKIKDQTMFVGTSHYRKFREIKSLFRKDVLVSELRLKFSFPFKISYEISMGTEKISLKLSNSFRGTKYICDFRNDTYEIICHKGTKYSIFRNSLQIAYFKEWQFTMFGKHGIKLVANDDADLILLLSFILALRCDFKNDYSTAAFDFGNIGPEIRRFDTSWKPNEMLS